MKSKNSCKALCLVAALAASTSVVMASPAAATQVVEEIQLRAGDVVFRDGPRGIEPGAATSPSPLLNEHFCEEELQPCFDYRLTLLEPGARLRVSIEVTEFDYEWHLFDPHGSQVAGEFPTYNSDVAVEDPEVGSWTFRVVQLGDSGSVFRIRARLEKGDSNRPQVGQRLLLPNLRMQPPFKFTLETPGSASGFLDFPSQARDVPPTRGCLPSEIVTFDATRCLRFSTGPENVGSGRLQLLFEPNQGEILEGRAFQLIDRSDGSLERREAGGFIYHAEHAHFHIASFAGFELLRVVDEARGEVVPAGTGPKQGFCLADVRIVDWFAFNNTLGPVEERNCGGPVGLSTPGDDPTREMQTGLSIGWADIYEYYQEGNFIDMGDNGDGLYVVRVRANAGDVLHETTLRDNTSYALIEIAGDDIEVLERGYGTDPWDPQKQVVSDLVQLTVG